MGGKELRNGYHKDVLKPKQDKNEQTEILQMISISSERKTKAAALTLAIT